LARKTLILYSTVDGQTRVICERVRQALERAGDSVEMASFDAGSTPELARFDRVVIGASIRYGRHRANVVRFLKENAAALQEKGSAVFSVNVVARKAAKNRPDTNPYMQKLLRQIGWVPPKLAVFAGKLDYPRYGLFDRAMIRLIMLLTGGPTDPKGVFEFTDWAEVDAFARSLAP
jgi:menaquinone-dependent protoporphyrinogen oxidase